MKKGIIYSFIISMVICMIMPFTVNAAALSVYFNTDALRDEWNGKILGDFWQYTTTDNATDNDLYIYKFRFDQAYIGQIQFQVRFSGQSSWASGSERVLVAGYESFDWYYREYTINNTNSRINAVNITSVNLTPMDDFGGDLTSIISYLQSIDATEDDIYTILQSVSSDTETLTKIRQWNVPFESYSALIPVIYANSSKISDIFGYNYFDYPIFSLTGGDIVFDKWMDAGEVDYYIYLANKNIWSPSIFAQNIDVPSELTLSDFVGISRFNIGSSTCYINKIKVTNTGSSGRKQMKVTSGNSLIYTTFYINRTTYKNVTTDFALSFGLSNQLLDDLNIVAQGTQQSQSAAGDLEQGTSDLASDISSYNQIESDYNNQMNQALNNIDFSDQFSNNQNFLSGASFVKTVFNSFMQIDILRIFFIVLCIVLIAKRFI